MTVDEILLVDDSIEDSEILARLLDDAGFSQNMVVVSDPLQALAMLDGKTGTQLSRRTLILLDIGLPHMSGLDLAGQIRMRPEWSHAPIVMLTESANPEHVIAAKNHNVAGYVLKQKLDESLQNQSATLAQLLGSPG
ncbi:MAG: response regulator [Pseudomonadota bacterium]